MAEPHTEVQETTVGHSTDLTEVEDEYLADVLDLVFPERLDLYDGPGAFSKRKLREHLELGNDSIAARIRQLVKAGKLVEVKFRPPGYAGQPGRIRDGYVKKEVYEQWQSNHGRSNGEQPEQSTGD